MANMFISPGSSTASGRSLRATSASAGCWPAASPASASTARRAARRSRSTPRDGQWLYCAASGTHELLVYRLPGLPFQDYGGPGDHIDAKLLADKERFFRIPLGGRPMALRVSRDGRQVY